jgi:hypothetical protein
MTRRKLRRTHAALLRTLDLGIDQVSDRAVYEVSAPAISEWSVKDHLEHLAIANEGIVGWIERVCGGDHGLDSGGGPNLVGRIVLLAGAFPRGRGTAPERTLPKGTSAEKLVVKSRRIRECVEALQGALPKLRASSATRNHFAFGDLNAAQWLRFALIHNHHHQKIIRDILNARGVRRSTAEQRRGEP